MASVRVAVIGTGWGGSTVLPGFRCVEGAEVVAVVSGRLERAVAAAAEHGVADAFDDYRAMLDAVKPDLVAITTPPFLHREMTLAALAAGAHVLCEKPLAMNVAEGADMLDAAERLGRIHAVDFEHRFIPARVAFSRLLAEGAVGEPYFFRMVDFSGMRRGQPYGWWFDRTRGGGVLQATVSHQIDAIRGWLGEFDRVTADLRSVMPERSAASGDGATQRVTADDTALVSFRLRSGLTGCMDFCWVARGQVRRTEVFGTEGVLILEGTKVFRAVDGEPQEIPIEDRDQTRLDDPRIGPFVELAQRLVDRINGKESGTFATLREGLEVQRVMDAIRQASDEGHEVIVGRD
ncbi:MAG: Gfo/Idh/MocA family oxidoreductase [Chloroflexi bacterium]|nr:Gfo/Idh/MocA family oxidoreductase [Chloroflexota bacterium]